MSYILDALRRAEHERRRADSTMLETVTQVLAPPAAPPASDVLRRWVPGLVLAGVLLVGVIGGLLLRRSNDSQTPSLIVLKSPAETAAPARTTAPAPAPPAPQVAAAPAAAPVPAAAPPSLTPAESLNDVPPLPAAAVAPQAPEDAATLAAEAAPPPDTTVTPMPVAPAPIEHHRPSGHADAGARAATAGARQLQQMPDSYRAHFPAVAVDVHVYDDEPSRRFVIIGGRRYGEGDTLSAGPRLVQIVPEGMVLDWQGQRVVYALAH
jgi:general secretion pathway protein B